MEPKGRCGQGDPGSVRDSVSEIEGGETPGIDICLPNTHRPPKKAVITTVKPESLLSKQLQLTHTLTRAFQTTLWCLIKCSGPSLVLRLQSHVSSFPFSRGWGVREGAYILIF